jgi:hypothetical protein
VTFDKKLLHTGLHKRKNLPAMELSKHENNKPIEQKSQYHQREIAVLLHLLDLLTIICWSTSSGEG